MVYGIIMAGGKGERFWPLSRTNRPKQFLRLTSDRTMLDETINRVQPIIPLENIRIVTGSSLAAMALESVDYLEDSHILAEPVGRNTSLAIGFAAVHLQKDDPEAVMVVLSADHLIRPVERLLTILNDGIEIASKHDVLITIGIIPTRAETGYGYIKVGDIFTESPGHSEVYKVSAFTEKPQAVLAQEYYHSRKHLWNAGMFIWSVKSICRAFEKHDPETFELLKKYQKHIGSGKEVAARKELFEKAKSISIDYAVLEKAENVLTIKADITWDDIGSWTALDRYKEHDNENNVVLGEATLMDTFETTVVNESDGMIACLGVSDLVIVRSDNITFIAHKAKIGQIRELLAILEKDESKKLYL